MARSESYWSRRAEERLDEAEKASLPYLRKIQVAYSAAADKSIDLVKDIYRAYYSRTERSFDAAALDKIAPRGDVSRFMADMKAAGLSTYLPDNYKGRMTRLELLNAQIWGEVRKAAVKENTISSNSFRETIQHGYYRNIYDMARGGGVAAFSKLDSQTIEKVLSTKFYGRNYSERIWGSTERLTSSIEEILTKAVATGQSSAKTARALQDRFGVKKSAAMRLVQTETAYFHALSELESYKAMGIEQIKMHCTLDGRTCDVVGLCRDHDGKVINLKDAKPGVNIQPFHPYCRCYFTAYFGKEYEPETRIYRDPETGRNKYTRNVSYEKWAEQMKMPELIKNAAVSRGNTRSKDRISYAANDKKTAASIGVTEKYWNNDMEASERQFARNYTQEHTIKWIDKNSRLDLISGRPLETNDYLDGIEKMEYELKTPLRKVKYSSIAKMISDAAKSGYKKNFMINLGDRKVTEKLIRELEKYNERHKNNTINNLKVWSRNTEYKIKLK